MESNNDQFKLETLRPNNSSGARPTIPYFQFPRPNLQHLSTSFDNSTNTRNGDGYANATLSASSVQTQDSDFSMDAALPSGHRRRRSSLKNGSENGTRSHRSHRTPGQGDILEDPKAFEDDLLGSGDNSRSNSEDPEPDDGSDEEGLQDDEETGLTTKDRDRRRERKRRNTLLDQRIAGDSNITDAEKKEADMNVIKRMLINGFFIGLWYFFSLTLSIYNKWMFSAEHLDFQFPLFTTCVHMIVQFSLAALVLYLVPKFRPQHDSISQNMNASDTDLSRLNTTEKKSVMTRWFYVTRVGPCGLATGLDIGLGNMSLKYISLTFYTMCKSSSLAFVLIFAFIFRLETPTWRLVAIIGTMTVGVIMMVSGEVDFKPLGFFLVISAAFFAGFRWGLTQILLLRNPATSNPFSSIFFLAPVMFLALFVIAVPVEGFPSLFAGLGHLISERGILLTPIILLSPGVLAFCMTASEFALLQRTSVVTLSIAGISKEIVTILAAGSVFNDTMTAVNLSGLAVTLGAIAGYNYIKITKMREEARIEAHLKHLHSPAGGANGEESRGLEDEDTALGDWDRQDGSYVTMDGDFVPKGDAVKMGAHNANGSANVNANTETQGHA